MGRDKALLPVDGEPMALRVARALFAAGAARVVCVGGDATRLAALGLDAIPDEHPDEGPLGGFVTALRWSTNAITVITPCDLLTPQPASFATLVDALAGSDAMAAVPIVDGRWRSMPAALRSVAANAIEAAFASGARAARDGIAALTSISVDAGPLDDADSPDEVKRRR
jgi:molybdopterin-guanine dinucleotide biosynthesis protein A